MSPATPGERKTDALRDIYLDAVAEDRGPDAASSERILAHARRRAAQAHGLGSAAEAGDEPAGRKAPPDTRDFVGKPAANERHWRRHALGGLAALGLVGWLMLQHPAGREGGSRDASPTPAAETAPRGTDAPAGRAEQLPGSAAPPAPMPTDGRHAPIRPAPAAAEESAKAVRPPQERAAQTPAADAKQSRPAQLPWCPDAADEEALGVAGKPAALENAQALPGQAAPSGCRPREKARKKPQPAASQER
ncbi:hypothetical protein [Comamonas terrae]|uniref:DUF3619 family protein n=1 Tax=Comamonas terrae TaxID=673548 RepID=A0ABW5UNM4_9BURK|nr:hypothetical protein [Comamonas terrae]